MVGEFSLAFSLGETKKPKTNPRCVLSHVLLRISVLYFRGRCFCPLRGNERLQELHEFRANSCPRTGGPQKKIPIINFTCFQAQPGLHHQ